MGETRDVEGNVNGKYGYLDSNGVLQTVEYGVKKEGNSTSGFDVKSSLLPQQVALPQSHQAAIDLQATHVAAAERQQAFEAQQAQRQAAQQAQFQQRPQFPQQQFQPQSQFQPQPQSQFQPRPQPQAQAPPQFAPQQFAPQPQQFRPQPQQFRPQPPQVPTPVSVEVEGSAP